MDQQRFGSDPASLFRKNLSEVNLKIQVACKKAHRDPKEVRLLPITKTVPPEVLRLAYEAGIRQVGENKIQEAWLKSQALSDLPLLWSIVGHLQTNKAKMMLRFCDEFHALDREKLAQVLNENLEKENRDLSVYVQVNTSGEESKFGLAPEDCLSFIQTLKKYPRLKPVGLMTLALWSEDPKKVRPCFQLLRRLRDEAQAFDPGITGLSMGMSGDYEMAIEEGATVVRVGQAIFGQRPTPNSEYWPVEDSLTKS